MTDVQVFLLVVAAVLVVAAAGEWLFTRTSIPDALWLLGLGTMIGPVLHLVRPEDLSGIAPYLGAITIVAIIFEGGTRLELRSTARTAPRALILAVLGFGVSIPVVAGASMVAAAAGILPQPWSLADAVLLGAILGGSSSVVVMPAVIRARVPAHLSGMVSLESALTDILCIVAATSMVQILAPVSGGGTVDPAVGVARTFGVGLLGGVVGALVALVGLRLIRGSEQTYPLLLAGLFALYVAVDANGGSAPLAVLVVALVVSNAALPAPNPESWSGSLGPTVRGFHGLIAFLIKAFFFTFMGAMLGPFSPELALGVLLAFALLIVRLAVTAVSSARSGMSAPERRVVAALLPRGLAAGVLAGLPVYAGVSGSAPIPAVTYATVLASILIFAVAFPLSRRGLAAAVAAAVPTLASDSGPVSGPRLPR